MRCQKVRENLSLYIDRALPEKQRAALEKHLHECPRCRRELEAFQKMVQVLGRTAEVPAPVTLAPRVRESLEQPAGWRSVLHKIFVPVSLKVPLEALAMLLLVCAVLLWKHEEAPEPASPARHGRFYRRREAAESARLPEERLPMEEGELAPADATLLGSLHSEEAPPGKEPVEDAPDAASREEEYVADERDAGGVYSETTGGQGSGKTSTMLSFVNYALNN